MSETKTKNRLNKISEYEAQIGINEMIIEDYQDDKVFVQGLQNQIDQWKEKIAKIKAKNLTP